MKTKLIYGVVRAYDCFGEHEEILSLFEDKYEAIKEREKVEKEDKTPQYQSAGSWDHRFIIQIYKLNLDT